jgi:lysozyme
VSILGIDVSDAQGEIPDVQWQAIALDKRFVYCEARVGNDGDSKNFARYVAGARAAGMTVGAYLFAYCLPEDAAHPGRSPEDQAQAFFKAASGLGGTAGELAPVVDLEWPAPEAWGQWGCSQGQIVEWADRCLAKVESLFGRTPVLYSYPYFLKSLGGEIVRQDLRGGSPLWLAVYGGSSYRTFDPWPSSAILQTGAGSYRLPNGSPCDEDAIADDATFAMLTGQA